MEWLTTRAFFPHTQHSIYLNHAAVSPLHLHSLNAMRSYQEQRSTTNIEYFPEVLELKNQFKKLVGTLINARPENIAITPNTSLGLSILAQGIRWKPGDRILLNNFEFPANVYPFLNLQEKGVEVDFVSHREGRIRVDDLFKNIRSETRLLSISFVEFLNGYRNDLKAIGEMCRQRGIIFCVDGIQGVGALEIDVQSLNIDFLACGGHKWLMWPMGTGFFYVAPDLLPELYPVTLGWLSVENAWDFFNYQLKPLPTAERFEAGAYNVQGIVGAVASLKWFLELKVQEIERRILFLTDHLIGRLQSAGFKLFTPVEPANRSGIVTFYHHRAEELHQYLKEHHIHTSLRAGMIRVSPHFYNTKEEIDELVDKITEFSSRKGSHA